MVEIVLESNWEMRFTFRFWPGCKEWILVFCSLGLAYKKCRNSEMKKNTYSHKLDIISQTNLGYVV